MTTLASAVAIGDNQLVIDMPFAAGQIPGWVKIDSEMLYAGGQDHRLGTTLTLSSPATATHSQGATVTYAGRPYDSDFLTATGGGGGHITIDNTVDAPAEVATLIAPGATLSDGEATLPDSIVATATITLTDAQIKALPTTGIEIVPAPGAGRVLRPYLALIISNFATVYTNLDAGNLGMVIDDGAGDVTDYCSMTGMMNSTTRKVASMGPYSVTDDASGNGVVPRLNLTGAENSPLTLFASNAAAGNLTGGNAANTLKVIVHYVSFTV